MHATYAVHVQRPWSPSAGFFRLLCHLPQRARRHPFSGHRLGSAALFHHSDLAHRRCRAVAVPLILSSFYLSLSGRYSLHQASCRESRFRIWLYVSVTGRGGVCVFESVCALMYRQRRITTPALRAAAKSRIWPGDIRGVFWCTCIAGDGVSDRCKDSSV